MCSLVKQIPKVNIFDAAFLHTGSKGKCKLYPPTSFEWNDQRFSGKTDFGDEIVFFTDSFLHMAKDIVAGKKVAWILEPPPFRQCNYDTVMENFEYYDYVLTYADFMLNYDKNKVLFYPYGGSMIPQEKWSLDSSKNKTKLCSIIVSDKNATEGHKLRHKLVDIIRRNNLNIDVLGSGYGEYIDKYDGLYQYKSTLVISGENLDFCFDEKIIDAFATCTIPIFWGCKGIGCFFNTGGIISINRINDYLDNENYVVEYLNSILDMVNYKYDDTLMEIHENFWFSKVYTCAEDWIYTNYPFLFQVT